MKRRAFVRVAGGGAILAAAGAGAWALRGGQGYPARAVEAWHGPGAETEPRRRAVAYAITAPNPHNRQPWLVDLREPGAIVLHCDRERLLPETDPFGRQILVGHGAFIELLVLALAEQGWRAAVQLWPGGEMPAALAQWDGRPVARIALLPGGQPDPLFAHVLQRRTPKVVFDTARPVAGQTLGDLLAGAGNASVRASGTADAAQLPALRALCQQAAHAELGTPRTVLESIRLLRIGPGEILAHRDGISLNGAGMRVADALGFIDRQAAPAADSAAARSMVERFDGHALSAMGFAWLSTARNGRSEQIEAGRAYLRLQLRATALGLGMHPMSQALQEFPEMEPHYRQAHRLVLGHDAPRSAGEPTLQMLCRLGYPAAEVPATPRRAAAEFVRAA